MELLLKAAVIGVTGALISLVLKRSNPEMALILTLTAGLVVLGLAVTLISGVSEVISYAESLTGLASPLVTPVLKCVGIGIVTRLASDVCKDAGAAGIASSVELVGTMSALFISLPLIRTLIQMIGGLV